MTRREGGVENPGNNGKSKDVGILRTSGGHVTIEIRATCTVFTT